MNVMISSIRFRNSGRKCVRSASSTATCSAAVSWIDCWIACEADIARHNHNRVLEIDDPPLPVGQSAIVQDLEQDVEDVRMRLFHLVEQHDRVGPAPHRSVNWPPSSYPT